MKVLRQLREKLRLNAAAVQVRAVCVRLTNQRGFKGNARSSAVHSSTASEISFHPWKGGRDTPLLCPAFLHMP